MGLKSSALLLVTGAAIAAYTIPEANHAVIDRIDRISHTLGELIKEYSSSVRPLQQPSVQDSNFIQKSPLRPLQQPYLFSNETKPSLTRSDGTVMEPWNYRGNIWPQEWAKVNSDGSPNRDYVNWVYKRREYLMFILFSCYNDFSMRIKIISWL